MDTVLRFAEEAEPRCAALRLVGTLMMVGGISRGCTPLEPSQGLVMLEEEVGELQVRGLMAGTGWHHAASCCCALGWAGLCCCVLPCVA